MYRSHKSNLEQDYRTPQHLQKISGHKKQLTNKKNVNSYGRTMMMNEQQPPPSPLDMATNNRAPAIHRITPWRCSSVGYSSGLSCNNTNEQKVMSGRPLSISSHAAATPRSGPITSRIHGATNIVSNNSNAAANITSSSPSSSNDNVNNDNEYDYCNQPSTKRQRTSNNTQTNNNIIPMFLCVPMLVLLLLAILDTSAASAASSIIGASSNIIEGAATESSNVQSNNKLYHNPKVAPSRPTNAPDVDYGGVHPFDVHRHLYDPIFAEKKKRNLKQQHNNIWLRKLKNDKDKDKDKDKEKEEEKEEEITYEKEEEEEETITSTTTEPPTANESDETSTQNTLQFQGGNTEQQQTLSFQGSDTSKLNIAAATSETNDSSSSSSSSSTHKTTKLDPTTDHLYKPLRIQFNVQQIVQQMNVALSANDLIAATKHYLLIYEILPMTAITWGDILRVIPVTGGIYPLAAQGSNVDQLLPNGQSNENDASTGSGSSGDPYYDDPVRRMYCPDETTSGIEGGADLLIYATVNKHCGGATLGGGGGTSTSATNNGGRRKLNSGAMGTLASALSCQRDQYDRPITGSIDFCLNGMKNVQTLNVQELIRMKQQQQQSTNNNIDNDLVGMDTGASEKWDGWYPNNNDGDNSALGENREMIQYSVGVAVHGKL